MMLKGRTLYSTSGLVAVAILLLTINLFAGLLIKGVKNRHNREPSVYAVGRHT